jgi:hypothetical protein
MMMPLTKMKNIAGAEISKYRYFLPVSILFFKTLVSIVSSIGIDIGPSLRSVRTGN